MENTNNNELVAKNTETERVRLKLTKLIDRACDAFEDIVDNSDDDKARTAAAKEIASLWSKMHGLDNQLPMLPAGTNNIQFNVNMMRDTLVSASKAMRQAGDIDAAIATVELIDELAEISPIVKPLRPAFEEIVDLRKKS